MLQTNLKRLLTFDKAALLHRMEVVLNQDGCLNVAVLLSWVLCRIFVNKALTCPFRVLNVWFIFLMHPSQSFLREHFQVCCIEVVLQSLGVST